MSAKNFDEGKIRYDLIPAFAMRKVAEVFTKGANKYGDNNWREGMNWSRMTASMERHIQKFKDGEDFDYEMRTLHLANVAARALMLIQYYSEHPEFDDRFNYEHRIALDVDGVLCDFLRGWKEKFGTESVYNWHFDRKINERFNTMRENGTLDSFFLNLSPLIAPEMLLFEPVAYITSRPVNSEVTQEWLDKNGFPQAPVITTNKKDEALKKVDAVLIDDSYYNFKRINKQTGLCCYLYNKSYNEKYFVGHKRIYDINDIVTRNHLI